MSRLLDPVVLLLLPAFFAYTGMRTQLNLVVGWENLGWCAGILLVATLGKLVGTYVAARWTGMEQRDSLALGALMNTRGRMERIVLSPTLYAMMVVMAIVTTLMTTPFQVWLGAWPEASPDTAPGAGPEMSKEAATLPT
jgi:Kef-type K+ transport system membrane component KefB